MERSNECSLKLEKIYCEMDKKGVDYLLLYSTSKRQMLEMNGVHYVSNIFALCEDSFAIIPRKGEAILVAGPAWDEGRIREESWIPDIMIADDTVDAVCTRLRSIRKGAEKIGICGCDVMPIRVYEALVRELSNSFVLPSNFLETAGRSKTAYEIEKLKKAQEIADYGFRALVENAKVGIREYELAAAVTGAMVGMGAMDNFGLLASAKSNPAIRLPTDRKIEPGDIIIAEITPEYDGYFAQLCRTVIVGEPSKVLWEKYGLLKDAFFRGLEAAKPGKPTSSIPEAIDGIIIESGYEEFCKPPYMRSRGHGLGEGSILPGELTRDNGVRLEEGMSFIIHPNQYIPETGYLMLGDTVIVSAQGVEPLSGIDHELAVVS